MWLRYISGNGTECQFLSFCLLITFSSISCLKGSFSDPSLYYLESFCRSLKENTVWQLILQIGDQQKLEIVYCNESDYSSFPSVTEPWLKTKVLCKTYINYLRLEEVRQVPSLELPFFFFNLLKHDLEGIHFYSLLSAFITVPLGATFRPTIQPTSPCLGRIVKKVEERHNKIAITHQGKLASTKLLSGNGELSDDLFFFF